MPTLPRGLSFHPDLDLFGDGAQIVVNTVNCVGVMNAGIPKAVADRFPHVRDHYMAACGKGFDCQGVTDARFSGDRNALLPPCLRGDTSACAVHTLRPGRHLFSRTGITDKDGPSWILHMPTKRHWRDPCYIEDIETGLAALSKALATARTDWIVHLPSPDDKNDGPGWRDIRPLLEQYLGGRDCARHTIRCRET